MQTEASIINKTTESKDWQLTPLAETAETICKTAIDVARTKLAHPQQDADLAELLGRREFLAAFKHALAQEVAKVIAAYDQRAVALYLFEESANPDAETEDYPPGVDLTIHLLELVTSASAAAKAFVASLDRALTEVLNDLPSAAFAQRLSYLDVIPITESDVENGRGYAVLLRSLYARPLKIWQRN